MTLIRAWSVINCANVTTAVIESSALLNKKRQASDKQPFLHKKYLSWPKNERPPAASETVAITRSPRTHLRRRHLPQLERKVVWVRQGYDSQSLTVGTGLLFRRAGKTRKDGNGEVPPVVGMQISEVRVTALDARIGAPVAIAGADIVGLLEAVAGARINQQDISRFF